MADSLDKRRLRAGIVGGGRGAFIGLRATASRRRNSMDSDRRRGRMSSESEECRRKRSRLVPRSFLRLL